MVARRSQATAEERGSRWRLAYEGHLGAHRASMKHECLLAELPHEEVVRLCPFCGEPEEVEIAEIWDGNEISLATCCEGALHSASDYVSEYPVEGAAWLRAKGLDQLAGQRSRGVVEVDGQLLIDWKLELSSKRISLRATQEFVGKHHRHADRHVGWRFGAGIYNGAMGAAGRPESLIGVVVVGRPVARMLDPKTVLEVTRVAVAAQHPAMAQHACSMAYGWAAREARKRKCRIVTYTRVEESGTSLLAAGWVVEAVVRPRKRGWHCKSRPRDEKETVGKLRWAPRACALQDLGGPETARRLLGHRDA